MNKDRASAYVLWIPSWYPSGLFPYDGDFIQRHAQAVSALIPVHVIHFVRDPDGKITRDILIGENQQGALRETIVYYYSRPFAGTLPDRIRSMKKFSKIYKEVIHRHFQQHGLPSLTHVHIAFKAGIIARWIQKKYGVFYLLTEQWTIYLEEARPNIRSFSLFTQYLITKIFAGAKAVLPVSDYLAKTIQKRFRVSEINVVPNVVNTKIFHTAEKTSSHKLKLIHVSLLNYQKDPESLFEAAGILKKEGVDFTLDLVGPAHEDIAAIINKENIIDEVIVHGEMQQPQLAGLMQQADALILYSRYETFGCVLIEANACGIPVIVPDTRLMHEIVEQGVNGILVHPGSGKALAEALLDLARQKYNFDKSNIAAGSARKYSYEKVGREIMEIYSRYI
jgi:glycosyltransferase involved in cell wall biosynthesis